MIDVPARHLETIRRILSELVPEYEVRAFGSRVAGRAKPYSDLDLVVVGDHPLPFDRLCRLREAFEESDLPFRVDALDWHRVSEEFRTIIMNRYEVLQQGGSRATSAGPSSVQSP